MRTENKGFFPGFSLVMAVIGVVLMSTVYSAEQAQTLQPIPRWGDNANAPLPEYSDVDRNMSHEWVEDRDVKSIWM